MGARAFASAGSSVDGDAIVTPALFPGYVFVLVALQWHAIRAPPYVVRLIMDGEHAGTSARPRDRGAACTRASTA